jgi:hypothetical protein
LLKHTGTYVFDYQQQDQLYKELHALAMQNQAQSIVQAAPVVPAVADTSPPPAPAAPVAKVVASSKGKKNK